jgi:uncharacterized SAM-binding protein YcdF (DUF218 family)
MFVFLSKLLPTFIYPTGLVFLLLLAAILLRKRARLQLGLLLVAAVTLWLGGNRWVALGLTRALEQTYPPPIDIPAADAIVLLGGATSAPDYPRPMVDLNSAADRLFYAAQLYRDGKAPFILITGGQIDWYSPSASSPAEETAELLVFMGVPRSALVLEPASRNTYENALFSRPLLEERGVVHILLVTSASHMPRSVGLFAQQGFSVTPAPTDFVVTDALWASLRQPDLAAQIVHMMPGPGNLSLTTTALKEYIGIIVYKARGWMP